MHSDNLEKLQVERQKLDSLVDEALRNGTPLSETHEIMAQCENPSTAEAVPLPLDKGGFRRLAAEGGALCGEAVMAQSRKVDGILVEAEREE